jgi:hypothetical protein
VLRTFFLLLLLPAIAGPARAEESWHGRVLHACEDEEGYPPFTFPGPDGAAKGFSVDLLGEALAGTGMRLDVSFLPTVRCNASVDNGSMDLSMEDFWDPDFAARWRTSDSLYDGSFVLYYDRSRHPDGLVLADVIAHPGQHRGCGLLGEVYDVFPPGQIDGREHLYAEAFDRVLDGVCEFYPDLLEFGLAYKLHGHPLLSDGRIGYVVYPIPYRPARPHRYESGDRQPLYVYLRRDFPDGEALITRINGTIARWRRTGQDTDVMGRYIDLGALPAVR